MKRLTTIFAILLFSTCTPSPTKEATDPDPSEVVPEKPLVSDDPCAKFSDSRKGEQAIDSYVIYRDYIKNGDWDGAYPYWQQVYEIAPSADGQRKSVFEDGIKFQERFFQAASDSITKQKHIDEIMKLYDHMAQCYPEGCYVNGRKAFDCYYKYRDFVEDEEILALFDESFRTNGKDVPAFVVNPMTGLMTEMFLTDKISMEKTQGYEEMIMDAIDHNLANCEEDECEAWQIVESYAPGRLESLEAIKGFYDCEYFKDKYLPIWAADSTDCDESRSMLGRLKYGGCLEEDAAVQRLLTAVKNNCRTVNQNLAAAYDALQNGRYTEAIQYFLAEAENTTDTEKKARYTLLVAKIYYGHLKDFPKARKYAREAAKYRDNWGEPYILIGKLYASSGPLCGPGRGFDSQVVTWVAIDKWNYAKRIDPSVAEEANKNIAQYAQYMPSMGDIFQRTLNVGDKYYVGCWIQESTTIRVKN